MGGLGLVTGVANVNIERSAIAITNPTELCKTVMCKRQQKTERIFQFPHYTDI